MAAKTQATLAFEEVRSPETSNSDNNKKKFTAFVLHGLLGSGRYLQPLSHSLVSAFHPQNWTMIHVDLRNHRNSAQIQGKLPSPPHDMLNTANDLADLVKQQGWEWPDVIIGHSMGAKVALQFVESCARGDYGDSAKLPKQIWMLDYVVGRPGKEFIQGLDILLGYLQSLPSSIPSKEWLVNHMTQLGFPDKTAKWMASNVVNKSSSEEHEGEFTWTWGFNLQGVVEMYNSNNETDYWGVLEHPPKGVDIEIVRAENSANLWDADTIERLDNLVRGGNSGSNDEGKVRVHLLKNSAHWVHMDNPKGLLDIMIPKFAYLFAPCS